LLTSGLSRILEFQSVVRIPYLKMMSEVLDFAKKRLRLRTGAKEMSFFWSPIND